MNKKTSFRRAILSLLRIKFFIKSVHNDGNDKLHSVIPADNKKDSRFRSNSDGGNDIILTISDNGIGIDEAVLPNLFSRYYQVESRSGSAGIGLSIVKWIALGHGGTIETKSKKGEGTRLTIRF